MQETKHDPVNHPKHYTEHPSGIEAITVTEHMNFCIGNAMKYLWRADLKNGLEDLKKAQWYITREIARREREINALSHADTFATSPGGSLGKIVPTIKAHLDGWNRGVAGIQRASATGAMPGGTTHPGSQNSAFSAYTNAQQRWDDNLNE